MMLYIASINFLGIINIGHKSLEDLQINILHVCMIILISPHHSVRFPPICYDIAAYCQYWFAAISSHCAISSNGYDITIGYSERAVSRDATEGCMPRWCALILLTKMPVAMIMIIKPPILLRSSAALTKFWTWHGEILALQDNLWQFGTIVVHCITVMLTLCESVAIFGDATQYFLKSQFDAGHKQCCSRIFLKNYCNITKYFRIGNYLKMKERQTSSKCHFKTVHTLAY